MFFGHPGSVKLPDGFERIHLGLDNHITRKKVPEGCGWEVEHLSIIDHPDSECSAFFNPSRTCFRDTRGKECLSIPLFDTLPPSARDLSRGCVIGTRGTKTNSWGCVICGTVYRNEACCITRGTLTIYACKYANGVATTSYLCDSLLDGLAKQLETRRRRT